MAYTPSPIKLKTPTNNFGGYRSDGNRVVIPIANSIQTIDATATPVSSPVTVNTTQTLTVPQGAVSCQITSVTNPVQISEDSTQGSYYLLPAASVFTVECANQQFIYLKTGSSTAVSFAFRIV